MFPSSFVWLTLSFAALVRCDLPHYITYKSFHTAMLECGQYFKVDNITLDQYVYYGYPSTPEAKRIIHCALVNLGAWNDKTGVRKHVIQFLFKPNEYDTGYEERTECCLDKIYKDGYDQNYLAYETFSCYYRQYGRLVKDEVYVPLEAYEFLQLLTFLSKIYVIPPAKLQQFAQGNFLDDPFFKQGLYAGSLRQGTYSLKDGFLMDAGYAQYNFPELKLPSTRKCVSAVVTKFSSQLDAQELVHLVYRQCFHSFVGPILLDYFKAFLEGNICGLVDSY